MTLGFLHFVHVPLLLFSLYITVSQLPVAVQRSRGHSSSSTQHCTKLLYPLCCYGYFLMMHMAERSRARVWKSKGVASFPHPLPLCLQFLPWSNFNKGYVTTWCWHSMSNIIPSVSRENVETCASITWRFQFSAVKNQATLKLRTASQSYLVIFIAFGFLEVKFRRLKKWLVFQELWEPILGKEGSARYFSLGSQHHCFLLIVLQSWYFKVYLVSHCRDEWGL